MNQGFICTPSPGTCKSMCLGCGRIIESGKIRLGTVIDKGDDQKSAVEWFHFQCFWEKCQYRSHLRGASNDKMTMFELVLGIDSLKAPDRTRLEQEVEKSTGKSAVKAHPCGLCAGKYEDTSVDGGDYELGQNTFDLSNLVCIAVFKFQLDVFVGIREYFKPTYGNIAKTTKKGITLTCDQWQKLYTKRVGINAALKLIGDDDEDENKDDSKKRNLENELMNARMIKSYSLCHGNDECVFSGKRHEQ